MQSRFVFPAIAAMVAMAALASQAIHSPARADTPAPVDAPVDAEACKACHGPQGISKSPAIPNLAGQKAAYLENQLKAFRAKDRKNDFMNAIAGQLSDDDIHQLALYWSSLPATPVAADGTQQAQAAGPPFPSRMTLPAGFPAGFMVYQTEVGEGAITKRYANSLAWNAAKAGQPLPEGSILFQVNYKLEKDAKGQDVAGAVTGYTGMESRAGWGAAIPVLLRNGDWDYAAFGPDGARRDQLNQAVCLACHKPQEASSYVFTLDKLRAAAKGEK